MQKASFLSDKWLVNDAVTEFRVFHQKDANGKANSEGPDQTVPLGAVRSGSALYSLSRPICPKI